MDHVFELSLSKISRSPLTLDKIFLSVGAGLLDASFITEAV
jgi:hypothetical protein